MNSITRRKTFTSESDRKLQEEKYSAKLCSRVSTPKKTFCPGVLRGHDMHMPGSILCPKSLSQSSMNSEQFSFSSQRMFSSHFLSLVKLWWLCLTFFVAVVVQCNAEDVILQPNMETLAVDKYLSTFGYYPRPKENQDQPQTYVVASIKRGSQVAVGGHTDIERRRAIKRLQQFFHLPVTGKLDQNIKKILTTPRCGREDMDISAEEDDRMNTAGSRTNSRRVKRYSLSKYGDGTYAYWNVSELTWRITRPSRQLAESKQKELIRTSLDMWARYMPVRFVEDRSSDTPDIDIQFARGEHGPKPDPIFDGKATSGGLSVLAHAWGPGHNPKGLAGDVHFDEDEDWTKYDTLLGVAVHELGHSMGLGHSGDAESIMFPYYRDVVELGNDDIEGIKEMYRTHRGPRPVNPDPNRPRTRPPVVVTQRPDSRYTAERPDPRYQTERPDPRYQTQRPDPRYQTERPDPRYQTQRPDPRYQTERPDPRYQTQRPDPRYQTERPDPRYQTQRPDPRYQTQRPDPRYQTQRPDPRYQTERPDPRHRTQRPDTRYWTSQPDPRIVPLNPGTEAPYHTVKPEWVEPPVTELPVDICATVSIDAVFEDPSTVIGHAYFAMSGEYLHTLTQHGDRIKSELFKDVYPEVPLNPDVAFSNPQKKTVNFIKDDRIWAYRAGQLETGYPRSLRSHQFPEPPKFSVTMKRNDGSSVLLLFGNEFWWIFDEDWPAAVRYQPISHFSRELPTGVIFATPWIDNYLYAVTKDSYVIMDLDKRRITHDKPIVGKPEWLHPLCADTSRASQSVTSLTALVILTIIKLFL